MNVPKPLDNISEFNKNFSDATEGAKRGKLRVPGTSVRIDLKNLKAKDLEKGLNFLKIQAEAIKANNEKILKSIKENPKIAFDTKEIKLQEAILKTTLENLEILINPGNIKKMRGAVAHIFHAISGGRLFAQSEKEIDRLEKKLTAVHRTLSEILSINHAIIHIAAAKTSLVNLTATLRAEKELVNQFHQANAEMRKPLSNYQAPKQHQHTATEFSNLLFQFENQLNELSVFFEETKKLTNTMLTALREVTDEKIDLLPIKDFVELQDQISESYKAHEKELSEFRQLVQQLVNRTYEMRERVLVILAAFPEPSSALPSGFSFERVIAEGERNIHMIGSQIKIYNAFQSKMPNDVSPVRKKILQRKALEYLYLEDADLGDFAKRLNDESASGENDLRQQITNYESLPLRTRIASRLRASDEWKTYKKRKNQLEKLLKIREKFPHAYNTWNFNKSDFAATYERLILPQEIFDVFDSNGKIIITDLQSLKSTLENYRAFERSRANLLNLLESKPKLGASEVPDEATRTLGLQAALAEIHETLQKSKMYHRYLMDLLDKPPKKKS